MKKKINKRTLHKLKVLSKKQIKNIIKKKAMKKIVKLVKRSKKHGQDPKKAVGKKVQKIKTNAKRIIKKITNSKKSKKSSKSKKDKSAKKSRKNKKTSNKSKKSSKSKSKKAKSAKRTSKKQVVKKDEKDKKTKKDKKDKKKVKKDEKSSTTSPIKKVSGIKKALPSKPNSSSTSVLTPVSSTTVSFFVPTETSITIVRNYSPLQIYFNFIYYTQPIGYMIYYNNEMTTYKTCEYMGGISLCEKVVTLPSSFTIDTHSHYFGIKFDDCPIDKGPKKI